MHTSIPAFLQIAESSSLYRVMSEKAAIDTALQANKEHQHALKAYIEQLEKELQTVDEMIVSPTPSLVLLLSLMTMNKGRSRR